ncbi:hypothetical protein EV360DRAFT_75905 [Lentinula raphanica]|nr:hypothetical protein EV360DRAFT_75905 [Lentinula raphanica]
MDEDSWMDVDDTAVEAVEDSSPVAPLQEHIESAVTGNYKIIYPAEPQPSNTVALPGKYGDGVIFAVYKDLTGLSRPALLELCREYQLGLAGKKHELKNKVMRFSESKADWQSLVPGARRSHRGVQDGGVIKKKTLMANSSSSSKKPKKLKQSVVRRNELMGLPSNAPLGTQLYSTERSKDMRTLEEKAALLRWADAFCETHPFIPREEIIRRKKAREEAKEKEKAVSATAVANYMQSLEDKVDSLVTALQALTTGGPPLSPAVLAQLPAMLGNLPMNPPSAMSVQPTISPPHTPIEPSNTCTTPTMDRLTTGVYSVSTINDFVMETSPAFNHTATASIPSPANVDTPLTIVQPVGRSADTEIAQPSAVRELTDTLRIGHGQIVKYNYKADVGDLDLPQISFAGGVTRLGRVWDDERPEWDPSDCGKNLLQINGIPIALRYWHDVFAGRKGSKTWSWLKKLWSEWRYVAERYHSGTPDEFWAQFSVKDGEQDGEQDRGQLPDGVEPAWSTIIRQLRSTRNAHEERLAEQAKAEYGPRFAQVFVNNRRQVLTKTSAIARRYLALQNSS